MKSTHARFLLYSTLTLFFGLQAFRVFLPKVIWYLGRDLSAEQMALFALGVFAMSLLYPVIQHWLGERGMMILTAGGSALVYVGYFFARSAPVYLALSVVGMILFEWFLLFLLLSPRYAQLVNSSIPLLALSLSLAFLLDTLIRLAQSGNDIAWQHSGGYLVFSLSLALVAGFGVYLQLRRLLTREVVEPPAWRNALALVGLGGFFYLAMAMVYNPTALAVASGWSDETASLGVGLLACLAPLLCVGALCMPQHRRYQAAFLGGVALFLGVGMNLWTYGTASFTGAIGFILAALAVWPCLAFILWGAAIPANGRSSLWPAASSVFMAMVFMLVVLFLVAQYEFYGILYLAAVLTGVAAVFSVTRVRAIPQPFAILRQDLWQVVGGASVMAAIFVGVLFTSAYVKRPAALLDAPSGQLRVMTYNIHQGINADLVVDLNSIADAIAAEEPDIVILNEVNRARATNGFLDVLPLISKELKMPYIFGANYADGQYGNALLSRYPVAALDNTHFLSNTTEVRGVLRVVIDGPGGLLTFYATHLDHIEEQDNVRLQQVQELLALWGGEPRSIILGDLNATPDTLELSPIYQAGFIDVLRNFGGLDDAFTFWDEPPIPGKRIDFIFITPDLKFGRVWIPQTRASDHLPVVAEIVP